MKKKLLGVSISIEKKEDILQSVEAYLLGKTPKQSPFVIVTPNPEQIMLAVRDREFQRMINRADVALPDGVGVVWAIRRMFHIPVSRITGVDFLSDLIRLANKLSVPIACVGGKGGVAAKSLSVMQSSYTALQGFAIEPEEMSEKEVAEKIVQRGVRMVFAGLGAPKQEEYMDRLQTKLLRLHAKPTVIMAVGGSFDMISGAIPRAPIWMQRFGIEWLYRLVQEPWRWKRQYLLIVFFFRVLTTTYFK